MCTIFGSPNPHNFEALHNINMRSGRGNFARGILAIDNMSAAAIQKGNDLSEFPGLPDDTWYFMGHIQSPTGDCQVYDERYCHPFHYKPAQAFCAHNGVISNVKELVEKFSLRGDFKVDSQVLLPLYNECGTWVEVMKHIKGTAAIWSYHYGTKDLYLIRAGCTLYANRTEFSSVPVDSGDFKEIENNTIHRYDRTKGAFEQTGSFYTSEQFFL